MIQIAFTDRVYDHRSDPAIWFLVVYLSAG